MRKLISIITIAASFTIIAAMLGQLDILLASWYGNPSNTWTMPLPFIFNKPIKALLAWEIIYGLILASAFIAVIAAYEAGKS